MFVLADEENDFVVVSENIKYYKTVTYKNNNQLYSLNNNFISETFEVSEEEFNLGLKNSNIVLYGYSGVIETNYKKMTTTIASNGNYYRYKVVLNWKNIPATRSYDIIGIGFLGSVKVRNDLNFIQEYCTSSSSCTSSTANYPQIFTSGAGTTFKLPTGTLTSLKQTLYFDVEKNTTSTIILQEAYGDYSHATSSISLTNAKKFSVVANVGISLNSSITSYYDAIGVAKAGWEGTW
jgi:hypothetical protein